MLRPWLRVHVDSYTKHYKALSDITLSCRNAYVLSVHFHGTVAMEARALFPFLEVSADKVTGLIDVCLQSPSPVYRFNTNLHFWGAGEQSACGDERHHRNPPQTSWSVFAVKVAVLHCSHSCVTPGCDINLCPILQENCPRNTKLSGSLLSELFTQYRNASKCVISTNGLTAGPKSSATIWQRPGHSGSVTSMHSNLYCIAIWQRAWALDTVISQYVSIWISTIDTKCHH